MNETGLIVAEVAFLVLLYAFVWTVVRSSGRQLRAAQPPPPAPLAAEPDVAAVRASAPPAPAPPVAPPPMPTPLSVPVVPPPDDGSDDATEGAWEEDPDRVEMHSNLDPRLIVEESDGLDVGRVIPLAGGMTIGRSEGSGISIPDDQFVSHMHARIVRRGAYHFVEDLGSTNGTFLNDRRIDEDAQLKVHDALRIGQTILRYQE